MRFVRVVLVLVVVLLLADLTAWPAVAGPPKSGTAAGRPGGWVHTRPPARPSRPGFLSRRGTQLTIDGMPRQLVGVNAYSLATDWSINPGCGQPVDVEALFSSLPPGALVRFWAFQSLATETASGRPGFAAIDRVVQAAERHGQKLVVVLGNHWGTCDAGTTRSLAWYEGGYARAYGDPRTNPAPYLDHVRSMVTRYRSSPAVGLWEPLNEPEVPCTSAPALRRFFDAVGGEVKRLDPDHLLGSGVIGTGQCGTSGDDYANLHASPAVDVASYHDYDDVQPIPGDRWNGMAVRMAQARTLGKPIITGELGLRAAATGACLRPAARRDVVQSKIAAQFDAGTQAVIVWAQVKGAPSGCAYEFEADDPVLDLVRTRR